MKNCILSFFISQPVRHTTPPNIVFFILKSAKCGNFVADNVDY